MAESVTFFTVNMILQLVFWVFGPFSFIALLSWLFGNWHQGRIIDQLAREEKLLNDSGAAYPLNNFSKPSQTGDIESSMLVMSSISVGPSWWQITIGWWKNFFGGEIKSFDKMLVYGRRVVMHRMRKEALHNGFDEVINVRVETAMLTKSSGNKNDKTAAYEFIAYGTAIKYVRS